MLRTQTIYKVTLSHPTGFHSGTHEITVTLDKSNPTYPVRNCSGSAFGYSRDYNSYAAKTDKEAIAVFLKEHACTVVKVRKVS